MKGNFTMVPNEAFLIPDHYARTVFFTLMSYGENYMPSLRIISQDSLLSINSVRKGVAKLLEYGIIRKIKSYSVGNSANEYEFLPRTSWYKSMHDDKQNQ